MNRLHATVVLNNALVGYVQDCAGANSEEANEIQEAWNLIQEPTLSPEEVQHLRDAVGLIKGDFGLSQDYKNEINATLKKVMIAIGIQEKK